MEVLLERVAGAGQIEPIARGTTDANGRITELGPQQLTPGAYRLRFDAGGFQGERASFYPEIAITFRVDDPLQHYHVPLLVGPWGYTTYRGT
jgi:5-hydroxyisourate hydrolase